MTRRTIGLVLAALLLAGAAAAGAAELTLVYSGNLDGELEPCGCSIEGDLGGLQRHASVIDRLRQERPDLVLISSGGLLAAEHGRNGIRNRFVLTGTAALGYDAIGLQWNDLAHGETFLEQAPLPWVASNWRGGDFAGSLSVRRDGLVLRYFQWLDPDGSPYRDLPPAQRRTGAGIEGLQAEMAAAAEAGELVLLGSTLSLEEARARLPLALADVYLQEAGYEQYGEPRMDGGTLVLQPGSRGQRLGRVDLVVEDGRITDWRHEVIPMPAEVGDAPRMAGWYRDYNDAQEADYHAQVAARQDREQSAGPYIGAAACAGCHGAAHEAWQASAHSSALERLVDRGKAHDPECVGCHSVGFLEPGGFLDRYLTPGLAGVQCESCHGGARAHVETAGQASPQGSDRDSGRMCARCHVPGHSPAFELDGYLRRLAHP